MSVQKTAKKRPFTFQVFASIFIGASLAILANTSKGKELFADAWLNITTPVLMLGLYFFIVNKSWKKRNYQQNILWSVSLVFVALLAIYQISHNWQYLPWGRVSAFKTADNFLVAMKLGDYEGATKYMKPCVREKVGTGVLGDENQTKPISWQLTDYEREYSSASTIGTAKLVNGSEVRIEFKMRWNGYKWEVFSVIFGEPYRDAILQFSWGC